MPHQPRLDRARAAMRLTAENPVGVDVLAAAFSIHRGTLTRWMAHGRRDRDGRHVWLDGIFDTSRDEWVSSAPAVERFLASIPRRKAKPGEEDKPEIRREDKPEIRREDKPEIRSTKSETISNNESIRMTETKTPR